MPDYRGLLGNRVKSSKGSELSISCPLPTHGGKDAHPSMTVSSETGNWYCHKEGIGGRWPRLAKMLGLSGWEGDGRRKIRQRPDSDAVEFSRKTPVVLPDVGKGKAFPKKRSWRGVSGRTVRIYGGRLVEHNGRTMLMLPVEHGGVVRQHQNAHLSKPSRGPSYLTGKGSLDHLFGLDAVDRMMEKGAGMRAVALCEGARDAMALADKGLPALALLGGAHWNRKKMLQFLDKGMRHDAPLVVMMDGDEAGRKYALEISDDLRETRMSFMDLVLPEDSDPADLAMNGGWNKLARKLAKTLGKNQWTTNRYRAKWGW